MFVLLVFLLGCSCSCFNGGGAANQPLLSPSELAMQAPADVAKAPPDATMLPSGVAFKQLKPGRGGISPMNEDEVELVYTGWTADGKMFFSTHEKELPKRIKITRLVVGLRQGVEKMTPGEQARIWVPEDLAYAGKAKKPAGRLVYDVELVRIYPGPRSIPAPDDVAAPPADAVRTASGLAYVMLAHGTGTARPTPTQSVTVNRTGWTSDGKMFDTSLDTGRPATMTLKNAAPGLGEALQLMVVGDKMRVWIPAALAYGDKPAGGAPAGQLTFELELVGIQASKRLPSARTPAGDPSEK